MQFTRRRLALSLATAGLAATLCAPAAAQTPMKLKIADSFPVGHYIPEYTVKVMMQKLKAKPELGLDFEYYPADAYYDAASGIMECQLCVPVRPL